MDGVAAVRSVMVADTSLVALVPPTKIKAGPLSLGTIPPAISLQSVSKMDRNIASPGVSRHVTERVQVTVMAANYESQKAILRALRAAAADQINPAVAGISRVTIHTDSAGPDFFNEETSFHFGSQDFRVTYTEER